MNAMRFLILVVLFFLSSPGLARTLTAKDIIANTKTASLKGKILLIDPLVSEAELKQTKSQYDTTVEAEGSYTEDKSERSSPVFGTSTNTTSFGLNINQLTPLGTQFQFGFQNTRESTNSAFATQSKFFESTFEASLTQPLLKNSFGTITRKNVALAKANLSAAKELARSRLKDLIYQNLLTYWNWYFQTQVLSVHKQAVDLAAKLYQTNTNKLGVGLIERADLFAFAANLDLKKNSWFGVKNELNKSTALVQTALALSDEDIKPGPEKFNKTTYPTLDEMQIKALEEHPEISAIKKDLQAQNINVAIQKNERLPQIDIFASLASNGIDPKYATAISDTADFNPSWTTGLRFSLPLQNRAARGAAKKSYLIKTQKLYDLKDKENEILAQIKQSYENYQNTLKQLHLTSDAVFNQKQKWLGEVKKYEQGRSDPDTVIRFQDDYLNTKIIFLQAQVGLALAKIDLDYARGVLGED